MKDKQRKAALKSRRSLTDAQRSVYSRMICEKILALPELEGVRTVFSYLSVWDEVKLGYANQALLSRGITVAYPVCISNSRMEAYAPNSEYDMEKGAYGIWAPLVEKSRLISPEDVELVLTPCVAFDREKNRLGHGVGYYDRYLPRCGNVISVGIAFDAQELEFIKTDRYDRKMDIIVTESAVLR